MKKQELQSHFAEWNAKYSRNALKPMIDNSNTVSLSWFGGNPSCSARKQWPVCRECKNPMQFFLQLDLASLPECFDSPLRHGLLQLFYCSSDDGICETWEPFSGTHEIYVVERSTRLESRQNNVPILSKSTIADWQLVADAPSTAEHELLGIEYDYDFTKHEVSVRSNEFGIKLVGLDICLDVSETISTAMTGDKLGGWPAWVQGPEYPTCTECGTKMQLVFQIDSKDNLDYMFGDVGCAHITQCPIHPNILTFAWAC
jgi:uncharacterized protein YwqG